MPCKAGLAASPTIVDGLRHTVTRQKALLTMRVLKKVLETKKERLSHSLSCITLGDVELLSVR